MIALKLNSMKDFVEFGGRRGERPLQEFTASHWHFDSDRNGHLRDGKCRLFGRSNPTGDCHLNGRRCCQFYSIQFSK